MIRTSQVIRAMASAILKHSGVCAICDLFKQPQVILCGHSAEGPLQPQDSFVRISLVTGDEYDMGYTGGDREVPIRCTFDLTTGETKDEGRIREYVGPLLVDDLAAEIVDAVIGIHGLGDEVKQANVSTDTSDTWPVCRGTINFVFALKRGTAFEPEM